MSASIIYLPFHIVVLGISDGHRYDIRANELGYIEHRLFVAFHFSTLPISVVITDRELDNCRRATATIRNMDYGNVTNASGIPLPTFLMDCE